MKEVILKEIKEIRSILAKLVGTSELKPEEQFSIAALEKAAQEYQSMTIERGEWIVESDISKIIRSAPYSPGSFLIKEFGFTAYFKKGRNLYFNRMSLTMLAQELKERNVNLSRYMELKSDKEKFRKAVSIAKPVKGNKNEKPYHLPTEVKDITSTPIPQPPVEMVREDLERLKKEFFEYKLSDYIDIYNGNHAMMKFIYMFEKYISPEVKRRCRKWVDSFNYANNALELITKQKETFVPVKDDDMYQL